MSLSRLVDLNFFVNGTFSDIPIYTCLENAILEVGTLVAQLSVAKDLVNNTTIVAINKGNDGTGIEEIGRITTDENEDDAIDINALEAIIFVEQIPVTKGDVIVLNKTVNGGGGNLGLSTLIFNERRY